MDEPTNVFARLLATDAADSTIDEGSLICAEGDAPDCWWYVVDGTADVTANGLYVGTIGPGETIGEISMLDGRPRSAAVTARSDMRVRRGTVDGFESALRESPDLAIALARQITARIRDLTARVSGSALIETEGINHLHSIRVQPAAAPTAAVPAAAPDALPDATAARVEYDPATPGYFDDPSVLLGAIREQESVHPMALTGALMVTRYEHVFALMRDRRLSVEVGHARSTPAIDAERAMLARTTRPPSMLFRDGDDHQRVRRLMQKVFTPKAIAQWRSRAIDVADSLLDEVGAAGGGDLISDYALKLPVQIISAMLGMPTDRIGELRAWSHAVTKTLDPLSSAEEREASVEARIEMDQYISEIYEAKQSAPGDDIFSALIEAQEDGDRLSRDEVLVNIFLLYVAGHETTTNLIGNGVVELLRHPDQLELLRANPDLDGNVVEEVLRYNSPVQMTRRIVVEDMEIDGVAVEAGSILQLVGAAANRDPRKWGTSAGEFRIDRPGANDQVSFGGGPHFCLGAALARLEGQVGIGRLVRRFPRLAATAPPVFEPRMVLRGVGSLDVTV